MKEQEFAKKIVSYLDEAPLSKSVEDRLSIARKIALSKAKKENSVEINNTSVLTLKNKINWYDNQLMWMILSGILLLGILLQNSMKETFFPNDINVTASSVDYENYVTSLNQKNQEFQKWDMEIESLLNDKPSENREE